MTGRLVLCIRTSPPKPADVPDSEWEGTENLAWCGRTLVKDEPSFPSLTHTLVELWALNGVWVCEDCAMGAIAMLTEHKRKR